MDGERILVIDDDRQTLALIDRFLSRSGYVVETASDGQAALDRLRREASAEGGNLALILCDLMMPGADGLRILEEAQEYCPDAVFCLVTGYATTDSAVAALRQGVYDYMTKPLDSGRPGFDRAARAGASRAVDAEQAFDRGPAREKRRARVLAPG